MVAACNICLLKDINCIEVQKYLLTIFNRPLKNKFSKRKLNVWFFCNFRSEVRRILELKTFSKPSKMQCTRFFSPPIFYFAQFRNKLFPYEKYSHFFSSHPLAFHLQKLKWQIHEKTLKMKI